MIAVDDKLYTAEEYSALPDFDFPTELVRGRIAPRQFADMWHGLICARLCYLLQKHIDGRDVENGHICALHGIITGRNPDSIRNVDVAYYSRSYFPHGPLPIDFAEEQPLFAIEVVSAFDDPVAIDEKAIEFVHAGVGCFVIVHPRHRQIRILSRGNEPRILDDTDMFDLGAIFSGFSVPVSRIIES